MRYPSSLCLLIALWIIGVLPSGSASSGWGLSEAPELAWRSDLTTKEYSEAESSNKLVLLNLEAVWCHWCHVMAEETYANPNVRALLEKKFVLVKIDQDSRPDLANRYQDYGWPATIVLSSKGDALRKFSGFIAAEDFLKSLNDVVKNPNPEEDRKQITYGEASSLSNELGSRLRQKVEEALDRELGGLKTAHKYLEVDTVEYLLRRAKEGYLPAREQAVRTLQSNEALIDTVWGGVYQYSTKGNWQNPHFEKLLTNQAENIRLYSLASRIIPEEKDRMLRAAKTILRFVDDFLKSPDGTYYTSQDADLVPGKKSTEYYRLSDSERRAQGIPKIDRHIYSDRNGRMIRALASLYRATGEERYLHDAENSANQLVQTRKNKDGGFSHGDISDDRVYLSDTLLMAAAFLELYSVTGDRTWLNRAKESADFIEKTFTGLAKEDAGLYSAPLKVELKQTPHIGENIEAVRFFNMLARLSGEVKYKTTAERAMRFLATPAVSDDSLTEIGIVIADEELSKDPVHVTIVAAKTDPAAKGLFKTAIALASGYLRTEWWDKSEGPMPNPDVQYPSLSRAAAFVCAARRCSLPIFNPDDIVKRLKEFGA